MTESLDKTDMKFSYYPGCTLRTKAKELDDYARRSAEALGVTLEEVPEWQCCGGVYPMAKDEIATKLSSVRTLISAKNSEQDLVTVCSACHHVVKRVNYDMQRHQVIADRVNNYLKLDAGDKPYEPYHGETNVIHYLEMLRDRVGFDKLKEKVVNPLTGRKIAAYYGCLLLRPSRQLQFDNPENPTIMEDFIRALGATPIIHAQRNECCGGYVAVKDPAVSERRCESIVSAAMNNGAEEMITACPLCMYSLDMNSKEHRLPIHYFTELLAEALGVK